MLRRIQPCSWYNRGNCFQVSTCTFCIRASPAWTVGIRLPFVPQGNWLVWSMSRCSTSKYSIGLCSERTMMLRYHCPTVRLVDRLALGQHRQLRPNRVLRVIVRFLSKIIAMRPNMWNTIDSFHPIYAPMTCTTHRCDYNQQQRQLAKRLDDLCSHHKNKQELPVYQHQRCSCNRFSCVFEFSRMRQSDANHVREKKRDEKKRWEKENEQLRSKYQSLATFCFISFRLIGSIEIDGRI